MKLTLHHVNFCSDNIDTMDAFYKNVLGLDQPSGDLPVLEREKGIAPDVHFRTDGNIQFHLATRDNEAAFNTGQIVNPLARGHIAFRTDDMEAVKHTLEENGVPYSDYGHTAVQGWHQIFFYDPDGNVVEIHQVVETNDQA